MRRPLLIITLLLLLLGGSWLFKERQRERPAAAQVAEERIDYYFHELEVVRMNEKGLPRERLNSERLRHHESDDSASLTAPRIQLRDEQGQLWHLRADNGSVHERGERVELHGKVRLSRHEGKGIAPLRLDTERMSVRPREGYAESDAPVRISDARATIDALGMRAHIDQQRLELPAQVRGTYDPSTP